jgi:hypothetical protein
LRFVRSAQSVEKFVIGWTLHYSPRLLISLHLRYTNFSKPKTEIVTLKITPVEHEIAFMDPRLLPFKVEPRWLAHEPTHATGPGWTSWHSCLLASLKGEAGVSSLTQLSLPPPDHQEGDPRAADSFSNGR